MDFDESSSVTIEGFYCRFFTFDFENAYPMIQFTREGKMTRSNVREDRSPKQLQNYMGALGSMAFNNNDTGKFYYEAHVEYTLKRNLTGHQPVFEIGLCPRDDVDRSLSVTYQPRSITLFAENCNQHSAVCLKTSVGRKFIYHEVLSSRSSGTVINKRYGFCFETSFRVLTIVDLEVDKILSTLEDINLSEPLWPVFGVYHPSKLQAGITLMTGAKIKQIPKCLRGQDQQKELNTSTSETEEISCTEGVAKASMELSILPSFEQEKSIFLGKMRTKHTDQASAEDVTSLPDSSKSATKCSLPGSVLYSIEKDQLQSILENIFPCLNTELEDALEFCLKERLHDQAVSILSHICNIIKKEEKDNCVDVYAAYEENDKWTPYFVLLEKASRTLEISSFSRWKMVRRRYDLVSPEAGLIMNSGDVRNNPISQEQMEDLHHAISSSSVTKCHSRITLLNACPYKSKKNGLETTKETCIVIHCLLKGYIPFGEDPFPKTIGDFPVDVREGYCIFGMMAPPHVEPPADIEMEEDVGNVPPPKGLRSHDYNERLLMGSSIGPKGVKTRGTLGGFVYLPDGKIGFLTCAHVVRASKNEICQPAEDCLSDLGIKGSFVCGKVSKCVFDEGDVGRCGIDAAVVTITDDCRIPFNGNFIAIKESQLAFAGFSLWSKPTFNGGKVIKYEDMTHDQRNMAVVKVGGETGLTRGSVCLYGLYAKKVSTALQNPMDGEVSVFHNQLEISPIRDETDLKFFNLGDSGSLVFLPLQGQLNCIGLAIGCTHYESCIVTPIGKVLDRLHVSFVDFTQISEDASLNVASTSQGGASRPEIQGACTSSVPRIKRRRVDSLCATTHRRTFRPVKASAKILEKYRKRRK